MLVLVLVLVVVFSGNHGPASVLGLAALRTHGILKFGMWFTARISRQGLF